METDSNQDRKETDLERLGKYVGRSRDLEKPPHCARCGFCQMGYHGMCATINAPGWCLCTHGR